MKVLIISRNNPMGVSTSMLLPSSVEVVVPENQKSDYEANLLNPIVTHPADLAEGGETRNWILDKFEDEVVIMLRDDIIKFQCVTGERAVSLESRADVLDVIQNTAEMAKGVRAHVFGFNEVSAASYNPTEPFVFTGVANAVMGVIGRKRYFIDDKYTECADYSLQSLMKDRIVWIDNRYFVKTSDKSPWNQITDYNRPSCEKLEQSWGKYIIKKISPKTGREVLQYKVVRKQKIEYGIWG